MWPFYRFAYFNELKKRCVNLILNNNNIMSKQQTLETLGAAPIASPTEQVSKKEQAIKVLQENEQAGLNSCAQELTILLQKYGYELEIRQTIELKKVR